MLRWMRRGVTLGLVLLLHHRLRPTGRAAPRGAPLQARRCCLPEQITIVLATLRGGAVGLAALLRFQDERAPLVALDAAAAATAVAIALEQAAPDNYAIRTQLPRVGKEVCLQCQLSG